MQTVPDDFEIVPPFIEAKILAVPLQIKLPLIVCFPEILVDLLVPSVISLKVAEPLREASLANETL